MKRKEFEVAGAALLCLLMLSASFYAARAQSFSTGTKTVFSSGAVIYGTPPTTNATLLFQSDFEDTAIVSVSGDRAHLNWGITHSIWFQGTGSASAEISQNFGHSGTRSLHMQWQSGGSRRAALWIRGTLEYYVSVWYYFPADYSISYGWHEIADPSYEYAEGDTLSIRLHVQNDLSLRLFTSPPGYSPKIDVYNRSAKIPLGQWFKLSFYVKRDIVNGRCIVWINDVLVFDITGETSRPEAGGTNIKVGKLYMSTSESPKELWIDDIEIYDTIP